MNETKNTIAQVELILEGILTDLQSSEDTIQAGYLRSLLDIAVIIEEHK